MRIFLKSFLLFALTFAAAYIVRILTVPQVVPIADGEQSGWQVQVAFLLTSVQNIGLFGMALVMILALLNRFRSLLAR
ncbi:hypothetical protein [Bradyrhizobium sp.]|jgi:hypothetical protein|uniref:hypothetical protein n=1 Tax=Bradyrhizobium sp. TaxID=376 RepID=UPI003D09B74E